MTKIPKNHPRYHSLQTREILKQAMHEGLVHETGLIAHGRGEAFDYLLGEQTSIQADHAAKTAAAFLLLAEHPVLSLNGNVVALAGKECIRLSTIIPAKIEVNLFHRTPQRIEKLISYLETVGGMQILGKHAHERIPGLTHDRAWCEKQGIFTADTILVPLEDGDRCQALKMMKKTVLTIDLNPLSRTAQTADVTIVDNVTRAIPTIIQWVEQLQQKNREELQTICQQWDNTKSLKETLTFLSKRLNSLF